MVAHATRITAARQAHEAGWPPGHRGRGLRLRAVATRCARVFGPLADWPAFAASWNDLGLDTYMADGGRYRKRRHAAFGAPAGEPIHAQAAPAALPEPRLQPAERRHRALVRAGAAGDRRRRQHAHDPGDLPRAVRAAGAERATGTSRCTSSASRRAAASRASRRPRACTATASTTCWCCWSAAATSRAASPRSTTRRARPRQLHADRAARRGAGGRRTACMHGVTPVEPIDPGAAGLPRRAGGDVPR